MRRLAVLLLALGAGPATGTALAISGLPHGPTCSVWRDAPCLNLCERRFGIYERAISFGFLVNPAGIDVSCQEICYAPEAGKPPPPDLEPRCLLRSWTPDDWTY